jgi:GYF domain 2
MTNDLWYYANGNEPVGPMSLDDLGSFLTRLPNGREIPVWNSRFAQWQKVKSVPELAVLFVKSPPIDAPQIMSGEPLVARASTGRERHELNDVVDPAAEKWQRFTKTGIAVLWKTYIGVGMSFGLILEGSYVWGSTIGSPSNIGLLNYFILFLFANLIGFPLAVLRTVTWLPGLIFWYFVLSSHTTFLQWLVPGIFVEAVRTSAVP